MLESTKKILLDLLKTRIQGLENAIYVMELQQDRQAAQVMKGHLTELLTAYSDLIQEQGK